MRFSVIHEWVPETLHINWNLSYCRSRSSSLSLPHTIISNNFFSYRRSSLCPSVDIFDSRQKEIWMQTKSSRISWNNWTHTEIEGCRRARMLWEFKQFASRKAFRSFQCNTLIEFKSSNWIPILPYTGWPMYAQEWPRIPAFGMHEANIVLYFYSSRRKEIYRLKCTHSDKPYAGYVKRNFLE